MPTPMTKSPVRLAQEALATASQAMPKHGWRSRKDFTLPQLFAILVLRQFFRTDYRGIVQLLADFPELRGVLGLTKVPHYSTLCYAQRRFFKKGVF